MTIISKILNTSKRFRNRNFLVHDVLVVLVLPLAVANILNLQINFSNLILFAAILKILIFYYFGLYNRLCVSASVDELAGILFPATATLYSGLLLYYVLSLGKLLNIELIPKTFFIMDCFLSFTLIELSSLIKYFGFLNKYL